jgi:MoxR-like ATPase
VVAPIVSCETCPSFLKASEASSVLGSATGSSMCSRYGKVLDRPGMTDPQKKTTRIAIAKNCDSYGSVKGLGIAPGNERTQVVIGDPEVMFNKPSPVDPKHLQVNNCSMCKNLVSADVVADELGWFAPLCAAKGKLILPSRPKQNAKGCEYKYHGPGRRSLDGMPLLPEYEDAFALASDPIKKFFAEKKAGLVEPQDFETEKDVTADDKEAGIRAWRRILDPEDPTREVYLPIFDVAGFSEDEVKKIPKTGDDEHPELYIDHGGLVYKVTALWTMLDETPALWGEPGSGKTELARHMAWLMQLPFERISITASSELDDLAGKSSYTPEKGTYFTQGRVPKAWAKKCVMVLDEPNTGPGDVWQFLRPLTDNSKQLVLDADVGQTVSRHDDCYLILAMNPDWDPRNRGAEPIADADGSRLMHVWVPMPPPELEKEIIRSRVALDGWDIDTPRLDMMMRVADEIRKLSEEGEIPVSWGIRSQIKVARALRWFDPITAYRLGSANYLEPSAQTTMLDIVRAHQK